MMHALYQFTHYAVIAVFSFALSGCGQTDLDVKPAPPVVLSTDDVVLEIYLDGFRYGFRTSEGDEIIAPHPQSGILAGDPDELSSAQSTDLLEHSDQRATFRVTTNADHVIDVDVALSDSGAKFVVRHASGEPIAMALRTAGAERGFGLGDHSINWRFRYPKGQFGEAAAQNVSGYADGRFVRKLSTDVTGFVDNNFTSSSGYITRMVSNFAIYPERGFALVNVEPTAKLVRNTSDEILQGTRHTDEIGNFHYFFGDPKTIYRQFLNLRNETGFPVMKPDYPFFGVGWEAWGALAWKTAQSTVRRDVDTYLDIGYPLSWMVIGSGFWPHTEDRFKVTTSFGLWDEKIYPNPDSLKRHFRNRGLSILLGLRISFTTDGPYSADGKKRGFFLKENGEAKVYQLYDFPKSPVYLLDASNPDAVDWYADLADKWGVDGFKEDLYSYDRYDLLDDKINAVNEALKEKGYLIMMRNNYLGSAGELHRIDDFNYDQNQDRGPVNSLTYAYSGLPFTYMDIIGGKFGGAEIDELRDERIRMYMMRNARIASLHSSMSMGKGPWHFGDEKLESVVLDAARLHARLHPYIYSQAVRFAKDGFPWTMTPLPLAYPNDERVYGRENETVRGYQWMIGDALLAYPLYGDDYDTATSRDVYLPAGKWIDYDTGAIYEGPLSLEDFEIPVEKTPLFVGGTGIVIEAKGDGNVIRVYPVADQSQTEFFAADGESRSEIFVSNPNWNEPEVWNLTENRQIEYRRERHAIDFDLTPGHDYEVR